MIDKFDITKAKYSNNFFGEADSIFATIDGVEMHVPINEKNGHYKAILAWVEEGNTIEEAD